MGSAENNPTDKGRKDVFHTLKAEFVPLLTEATAELIALRPFEEASVMATATANVLGVLCHAPPLGFLAQIDRSARAQ